MSPERIAQEVNLLQSKVVNETFDMLAQRLCTRGRQGQVVEGKHGDDDPHFPCKVIEQVLEVAQCTEQPVKQYQGCAFGCALHVAVTSVCNEILLHDLACA